MVVGPGGFLFDDRVNPDSLPEDIEFREEVLDCFPEADSHHGYPLPEHLPQVTERVGDLPPMVARRGVVIGFASAADVSGRRERVWRSGVQQ